MKKLFNKSGCFFGIESIGELKYLVDNLQVFSDVFTEKYFIERHSLIPLIRPFKTKEWYEQLSIGISSKVYQSLFSLKKEYKVKRAFILLLCMRKGTISTLW